MSWMGICRVVVPLALVAIAPACGGGVQVVVDGGDDGASVTKSNSSGSGGFANGGSSGVGIAGGTSSNGGDVDATAVVGRTDASGGTSPGSSGGASVSPCNAGMGGGTNLTCMGGDCSPGTVCCACLDLSMGLSTTSVCMPPPCLTVPGEFVTQLCASDSECDGGHCGLSVLGMPPLVCMPSPDAGTVADAGGD